MNDTDHPGLCLRQVTFSYPPNRRGEAGPRVIENITALSIISKSRGKVHVLGDANRDLLDFLGNITCLVRGSARLAQCTKPRHSQRISLPCRASKYMPSPGKIWKRADLADLGGKGKNREVNM